MVQQVSAAIERVHDLGYAVGDFAAGTNLIVSGSAESPRPIFCDLEAGKADQPNVNFRNDAEELRKLCAVIFYGLGSSSVRRQAQQFVEAAAGHPKPRQAFAELSKQLAALM